MNLLFDRIVPTLILVWILGLTVLIRDVAFTVYDLQNHRTASADQIRLMESNRKSIELLNEHLMNMDKKGTRHFINYLERKSCK
jgi:hypothetical protein